MQRQVDEGYSYGGILNVALYEELADKWDQLCQMLNKKAYAEQKRLDGLAAMQS